MREHQYIILYFVGVEKNNNVVKKIHFCGSKKLDAIYSRHNSQQILPIFNQQSYQKEEIIGM